MNKNTTRWLSRASLFLIVIVLAGCSRGPEMFTIAGQVTLDGAPIKDGTIMFVGTEETNEMGKGKIIEGNYSLECLPGSKNVQIAGYTADNKVIPFQYLGQDSGLTTSVSSDAENVNFELKSKVKRRR